MQKYRLKWRKNNNKKNLSLKQLTSINLWRRTSWTNKLVSLTSNAMSAWCQDKWKCARLASPISQTWLSWVFIANTVVPIQLKLKTVANLAKTAPLSSLRQPPKLTWREICSKVKHAKWKSHRFRSNWTMEPLVEPTQQWKVFWKRLRPRCAN